MKKLIRVVKKSFSKSMGPQAENKEVDDSARRQTTPAVQDSSTKDPDNPEGRPEAKVTDTAGASVDPQPTDSSGGPDRDLSNVSLEQEVNTNVEDCTDVPTFQIIEPSPWPIDDSDLGSATSVEPIFDVDSVTKEELLADLTVEYDDSTEPGTITAEPVFGSPRKYQEAIPYSAIIPIDDDDVAGLEAGSSSVRRSYLSMFPTTIQVLDEETSLFVWHATFHPAINRRFSSVIISVRFTPSPFVSQPKQAGRKVIPSITTYAPHKSYGSSSSEHKSISWGLELPISVPAGPLSLGVTPSTQHETMKKVDHAFTITGSARGTPARHNCVWTVEENASTRRGVPSELQLAAVVQHSGPLVMEVDISGWTAGGYLPSHHLRPKSTALGRRKRIDPARLGGLLHEYKFDGDSPAAAAKTLLESWTGKVDGAMLEFDQPLARS